MAIISGGGSGGGSGAVTQISATTAAATAASFAFTNIGQTFNHLWLIVNGRSDNVGAAAVFQIQLNGDSGANYDFTQADSLSSAAVTVVASAGVTAARIGAIPYTALTTASGLVSVLIPFYAGTTFYKTWTGSGGRKDLDNIANFANESPWGSWRNTAAVTTVTVLVRGNSGTAQNFVVGSGAALYGIT